MSQDVTQLRSAVRAAAAAAASVERQALRDNAMEACLSDLEFLSVLQPTKQRHLLPECHRINATAPCLQQTGASLETSSSSTRVDDFIRSVY